MKVGIITFHFCYNYGATLQCLGLYQTLKEMGHNVDVIDYHPIEQPSLHLWQGWGIRRGNPWLNIKKRWIDFRYGGLMRDRFDAFSEENMTFSKRCNDSNVAEIVSDYDALIVGSDQVWNRNHFRASSVYFLDFSKEYSGRRISYSACCGHKNMPQEGMAAVELALRNFDSISVRNQVTNEWLKELTGISAEIVSDPSFLCDYTGIESTRGLSDKNYIMAYVLGDEIMGGHQRAIAEIRKVYGSLPVVWVCSSAHKPESFCGWADRVVYSDGPAEWLNLIKNASFIYTDSFHGAAFSIKYKKPFFAYYTEEERAHRLMDIANRYGIFPVVANSVEDALKRKCFEQKINYSTIEKTISAHRVASLRYLNEALA